MPTNTTVRRVAALSFTGAAIALYAAQAGHLPFLNANGAKAAAPFAMSVAPIPPGAETPAALASMLPEIISTSASTAHVSDRFARTQTHAMPAEAGFTVPPSVDAAGPASSTQFPETAAIRPAAFDPSQVLESPRAPIARTGAAAGPALSPLGLPCGLDVTATAAPHATVALGVAAPCHPSAPVSIRHSGMTIVAETDAVGLLAIDIPAFESPAFVTVALSDGTSEDLFLPVPEIADYDRVALVEADPSMVLHAMEGDAGWASAGHVHPDAPRALDAAELGLGYLTSLGGMGGAAQVYTLPRAGSVAEAGVSFSLDAPVTAGNCTRAAEASMLRMQGGARVDVTPLSFTYPGCESVGDTLVLQNALGAVRLAAN